MCARYVRHVSAYRVPQEGSSNVIGLFTNEGVAVGGASLPG